MTDFNDFDKVEKLRSRANVTYEEARDALREANGDLLDAMVILEKQGKTTQPEVSTYSTRYEEQPGYERVAPDAEEEDAGERFKSSAARLWHVIWAKLKSNDFCAYRKKQSGKRKVMMQIPLWFAVILLIFFWEWMLPLMVILMFFGWRYAIEGGDLKEVNDIFETAGNAAESAKEHVKEEWNKT